MRTVLRFFYPGRSKTHQGKAPEWCATHGTRVDKECVEGCAKRCREVGVPGGAGTQHENLFFVVLQIEPASYPSLPSSQSSVVDAIDETVWLLPRCIVSLRVVIVDLTVISQYLDP